MSTDLTCFKGVSQNRKEQYIIQIWFLYLESLGYSLYMEFRFLGLELFERLRWRSKSFEATNYKLGNKQFVRDIQFGSQSKILKIKLEMFYLAL